MQLGSGHGKRNSRSCDIANKALKILLKSQEALVVKDAL